MNRLTQAGFELIKAHEGLRLRAYPDPATKGEPWTIGYGHTSAAGIPKVTPDMQITKEYAEDTFKRDLKTFENHVRFSVKTPITDEQFSALVSFCYNVGPGNFQKSSVLRCVNARQFDLVPAKLALYNRANGKVLKGLVRRRAEEGKMFTFGFDETDDHFVNGADLSKGKSALSSTTNLAAGVSGVAAVASAGRQLTTDVVETASFIPPQWLIVGLGLISILAAIYIIMERIKKSEEEGV